MRILINSINYHPELTGIGKYTGEMAEWLVNKGCDVRVISAPPYYPAWEVSKGYSAMWYRKENMEGVQVKRCPLWVPKQPTGLKRILHLASFALTSLPGMLWNALVWRPDLIFVVEPPLLCQPGALLAARLCKACAWLHIQDFEVDAAFELGILKSLRLRRMVQTVEEWLMKRFDRVSSISDRMVDKLSEKGVRRDRQVLFQNWVDTDRIRPVESKTAFRAELGIPNGVIILLYSGVMGKKQGLEIVVDAAKMLRNRKDIYFLMCGDGFVRKGLEESSQHLENIKYIPLQPLDRLNDLLNAADIHLMPQRAGAEDLVMPSKLTNMVASGRPVVATAAVGTQVGSVVQKCGIVVDPGDLDAFVEAIERLADNKEYRKHLGESGRRLAEESWEKENILSTVFVDYVSG